MTPPVAVDGKPLAGIHNGRVFLRDSTDYYRLFIGGTLHLDGAVTAGPGVTDTAQKATISVKRLRIELNGEISKNWQFMLFTQFGSTAFDNAGGTNESYASRPGSAPTATSGRYATVQGPSYAARPEFALVNYRLNDEFNWMTGQFYTPFTLDNNTGSNTTTFIEKAQAIRSFATPQSFGLGTMFWGKVAKGLFNYRAAFIMGDGFNRPNADNRADFAGRVYFRPFAGEKAEWKDIQIGASMLYGMRDKNRVYYDYDAMSTQAGYKFWSPTYSGAGGFTHILPAGKQMGVAGELRIPIERLDFRAELVYVNNNTREAIDGYQTTNTQRFGVMKGTSYYVQASYWI